MDDLKLIAKSEEELQKQILKLAAKIIEELSQLNGKKMQNRMKCKHTKERLGWVLKKKNGRTK
jgi:predicted transcriptional regulator